MASANTRKPWLYATLYCGFVLSIYIPGIGRGMFRYGGRQDAIIDALLGSPLLTLQIATYVLTVIILNLLPLGLLLIGLRHSAIYRRRLGLGEFTQFLLAISSLWLAILLLNKLHFPYSSFAILIPSAERGLLLWGGTAALAIYLLTAVLPTLIGITRHLSRLVRTPALRPVAAGLLVFSVIPPLYSAWTTPQTRSDQPDVIIIGLDSVSPLHLERHPGKLPILEELLAQSLTFEQNITPLGRTFPAWTSILTARYPVHSGARFNLTAFDQVETRATLPHILKTAGYATVYAQDERQFNNIDETFGFDHVIGPKAGAADIVLSKAADHPLVNLALLLPGSKQLLPFIALNRAAAVQYDPDEFVEAILDNLPESRNRPLFLATHFCLAHHPYEWRSQFWESAGNLPASMRGRHIHALQRLERQVDMLLRGLAQRGRLENAILVVLSDHGEALDYDGALWPAVTTHQNPHDSIEVAGHLALPRESGYSGHGTNTLDRTQYHTLLAFQGFGTMGNVFAPGRRDRISSLVDVAPTILGALGRPLPADIDGIDLLAGGTERNTRFVTAETGIRFLSLASVANIDVGRILEESHKYYQVEADSGRLAVRPEYHAELNDSKDLAAHSDDWLLALLRKPANPYFPRVAVLVHKPSGAWTLGGDTTLIANAPLGLLTRTLHDQYGDEIADFRTAWPFQEAPAGR